MKLILEGIKVIKIAWYDSLLDLFYLLWVLFGDCGWLGGSDVDMDGDLLYDLLDDLLDYWLLVIGLF